MVTCIRLIFTVAASLAVFGATFLTIMYYTNVEGRTATLRYQAVHVWMVQFNLTRNDTALVYNLAVNTSFQNPNTKSSYIIERVDAYAFSVVNKTYLTSYNVGKFYLGHKSAVSVYPWFNGERPVAFGANDVAMFKNSTVFDVKMNMYVNCWTRIYARKSRYKHIVSCYLKVPSPFLMSNSTPIPAQKFNPTDCQVYQTKIR